MFHARTKRRCAGNGFLVQKNMYYNSCEDYYACPLGCIWRGVVYDTPSPICGLQIGSGYVQNRRLYRMSNDGFESCLCCNIVGQCRFIPIPITRMSLAKRCFVKAKTIIGCNLLKIATDDCFYKSKIDRPQKLL